MGRKRKLNKEPTTTISVSVGLSEKIISSKPRSKTNDEFLNHIFSEWKAIEELKSAVEELKSAVEYWEMECKDAWKSLRQQREKIKELEKQNPSNHGSNAES